jgi:hypothetical protein
MKKIIIIQLIIIISFIFTQNIIAKGYKIKDHELWEQDLINRKGKDHIFNIKKELGIDTNIKRSNIISKLKNTGYVFIDTNYIGSYIFKTNRKLRGIKIDSVEIGFDIYSDEPEKMDCICVYIGQNNTNLESCDKITKGATYYEMVDQGTSKPVNFKNPIKYYFQDLIRIWCFIRNDLSYSYFEIEWGEE